jgi:hypothetical protein
MDKAAWANRLVADPVFKELIDDLKAVEIGKFVASDTNDIEARESAYIRLRVIEDIWNQLDSMGSQAKINEKRWKIL